MLPELNAAPTRQVEKLTPVEYNFLNTYNLLVIVPVYNEALNIVKVLNELNTYLGQHADILIVDDCSTDGTRDLVRKQENVTVLSLPFNLGYACALQAGYKYAMVNNYDYIVQFDGDGQHVATEIGTLVSAHQNSSADIIIGSRFVSREERHQSCLKRFATAFFCYLIKNISGHAIHDPTSGFQMLNRKVFERYSKVHNFPYYPDANIIIEMLLIGYRVHEVQVDMRKRVFGESMHDGLIRQAKYMIKVFYSIFVITMKYFPVTISKRLRA